MPHSKRPNPKEQDVMLNIDAQKIDEIIAVLERVKSIPKNTLIPILGEHGVVTSIERMSSYAEDLNIFIDYYLEETE